MTGREEPPRPYPQPLDPIPSCDWGDCDEPGVAWAWNPEEANPELAELWLPVCRRHFADAIVAGVWTVIDEVHRWTPEEAALVEEKLKALLDR